MWSRQNLYGENGHNLATRAPYYLHHPYLGLLLEDWMRDRGNVLCPETGDAVGHFEKLSVELEGKMYKEGYILCPESGRFQKLTAELEYEMYKLGYILCPASGRLQKLIVDLEHELYDWGDVLCPVTGRFHGLRIMGLPLGECCCYCEGCGAFLPRWMKDCSSMTGPQGIQIATYQDYAGTGYHTQTRLHDSALIQSSGDSTWAYSA